MGVLPPQRLKRETADMIESMSMALADEINVLGHFNLQLAVKYDEVYILEANPRSSRSVPFIAKATKVPLVDLAIEAVLGKRKSELTTPVKDWRSVERVCVKGVVFPFNKFKDADSILGPEMKSTGESMGIGQDFSEALLKAFISSSINLPLEGEVFLSLREKDKPEVLPLVQELVEMGFTLSGTTGTATFLEQNGLQCKAIKKVHEGRPNCVDRIRSGEVALVINTTSGRRSIEASFGIRRSCIDYAVPCVTESHTVAAVVLALRKLKSKQAEVAPL